MDVKEKLKGAFSLVFYITLDLFIVIIVSGLLVGTKYILEIYIYKVPLEQLENGILLIIYRISKISILVAISIYAIVDIYLHLIDTYKKLKKVSKFNVEDTTKQDSP